LEKSDEDVKSYVRVVDALYRDRVEELLRKHKAKDGKLNREKMRADFDDLIDAVKKKQKKNPAEAGLALFLLDGLSKRLFPKGKDDL